MKRSVKLLLFLATCFFFLIVVSLFRLLWLGVRFKTLAILARFTQVWARMLLRIIGIRIEPLFHRQQFLRRHFLIVSNHQSYLDIIVIASLYPTLFVAKKEMQQWPLLGWLASLGGTVFVDRQSFRGGMNSAKEVASVLQKNINVSVFPEGTSTDGTTVLTFRSSLLKAAVETESPVLPLSINYLIVDDKPIDRASKDRMCWYGSMEFIPHFWSLLGIESALVAVITHPLIVSSLASTPQKLAGECYDAVASGLIQSGNVTPQQRILMSEFS